MGVDRATAIRPATVAPDRPGREQRHIAAGLCVLAGLATAALLPLAARPGLVMPGFGMVDQSALVLAYALSAWVLFAQVRRDRSLPLLLVAGGTLYTATIVLLQMLSMPGVLAPGRLLGRSAETTTWLWTFWHLGPPLGSLGYTALLARDRRLGSPTRPGPRSAAAAAALALLAGAASALVATAGLAWLPRQAVGDDYSAVVSSGIGPGIEALTLLGLVAVWRATRSGRTVLDLWIAVSLVLLALDNLLTMAGGARGTLGWQAGRVEAVVSALALLWAYVHQVDALRVRAELAAELASRAEEALRQAQKMEAVGRLTGGVAHDFNNLLMVITSGLDMIRRRPEDHARVVKLADAGLEAAQRGARLTRQLLTFARRQSLRPETVNLNASLLEFEPLARRAVGEAVAMSLTLHPALHPARVDPGEFEAAVLNLVVNARDALPPQGGRLELRTRNAMLAVPAGSGEAGSLVSVEHVVVSVSDNGTGMDEAVRAQAFEPFFTTKEFGRGFGLGLSQVYGFARAAGGTVEIASAPGQGTTVEVWLPRSTGVDGQHAGTAPTSSASPLRQAEKGESVLAVEDEPALLSSVVESLTDLGYHVHAARDAAEALEFLRSEARVDVLFSDIVMPGGMNGVQLAVEAGRLRPGLRVLLTSGYTNEALVGEHRVPADVPILTKPYRREELAKRLRMVHRPAA